MNTFTAADEVDTNEYVIMKWEKIKTQNAVERKETVCAFDPICVCSIHTHNTRSSGFTSCVSTASRSPIVCESDERKRHVSFFSDFCASVSPRDAELICSVQNATISLVSHDVLMVPAILFDLSACLQWFLILIMNFNAYVCTSVRRRRRRRRRRTANCRVMFLDVCSAGADSACDRITDVISAP